MVDQSDTILKLKGTGTRKTEKEENIVVKNNNV